MYIRSASRRLSFRFVSGIARLASGTTSWGVKPMRLSAGEDRSDTRSPEGRVERVQPPRVELRLQRDHHPADPVGECQ